MQNVFERRESEIRSYCRSFPAVFQQARGALVYDEQGREFVDFFAGAGTLNYGHNNPKIKQAILDYLAGDGVVHALDLMTVAKRRFLEAFEEVILAPRGLDYKLQFTGPTGTNAVEAALKLARRLKQRANIVTFTNGYHGLSAGALAITGNRHFRHESFVTRLNASFVPFDGYLGKGGDTLGLLRRLLSDASSGFDIPAAIILETVQAEGGVNVASAEWLRGLEAICREFDILLIVDDIQVGNGRTGAFFSFEESGIRPDIVTLSKAIGGMGLPMSLVLFKREHDVWKPAEHTGTFRGFNLAFVAATAALDYWRTPDLQQGVQRSGKLVEAALRRLQSEFPTEVVDVRGRGLIWGAQMRRAEAAREVSRACFRKGLIMELAGPQDEVCKLLPPLLTEQAILERGLAILSEAMKEVLKG